MITPQDTESLMFMGLTRAQAIIYLTCRSIGNANAKEIWKSSDIGRQDVYRVLDELQKKGIIEKVIGTPTKFRATRIQDALSILLKCKAKQYQEAEEKVQEMLNSSSWNDEDAAVKSQFVLIENRDRFLYKIDRIHATTINNADIICASWSICKDGLWRFSDFFERCAKKEIGVRILVGKPTSNGELHDMISLRCKYQPFKMRFARTPIETTLGIYDKKEAVFWTAPYSTLTPPPHLFTNNKGLIATLGEYFDFKWNDSSDGTVD